VNFLVVLITGLKIGGGLSRFASGY
jgi:hypothetical protein